MPRIEVTGRAREGCKRKGRKGRAGEGIRDVECRKRAPFRSPRAFRRGEMARFSYRTDIRPVQELRTKSYIHASDHYASLSRLGSAVRRARRRDGKREDTTSAVGHFGWFFFSGIARGARTRACVPDSRRCEGRGMCGSVLYSRCRRGV